MAAREYQPQSIVAHRAVLQFRRRICFAGVLQEGRLNVATLTRRFAPEAIERPVASRGDDPTRWTGWQAIGWPALHCRGEGVLDGFLGEVDVAKDADQDCHGTAVLLTEDTFDVCEVDGLHPRRGRSQ